MKTVILLIASLCAGAAWLPGQSIPHLQKKGGATQLVVEGKPYLVIGGELGNSSTGSLEYMKPIWRQLRELNLNTALPVISWELIEPEEGKFDFTLVDAMIEGARKENLKLVPLWFGTWKNGMSSYVPLWVKKDYERFPRVKTQDFGSVEIISTFSEEALEADARAFAALMRHIKEIDAEHQTVIMMQVENEVGVLGDSRDRSAPAEAAYRGPVPRKLLDHLQANKDNLIPELEAMWASTGFQTSGSWEEVFGGGVRTEEVFMAWNYAVYMDKVTEAGKAEYALPMYVNAWLNGSHYGHAVEKPGHWPSGGPLPHVMNIWRAGGPHIDFISPDIYQPNFAEWCDRYTQLDNPLFIPETGRSAQSAANILYAFGKYNTIGTSPFAIDRLSPGDDGPIEQTYSVLRYLAPYILESQGKEKTMTGFLIDRANPTIDVELGGYNIHAGLYTRRGVIGVDDAHGIIIATGEDEFLVAGSRAMVSFSSLEAPQEKAGIGPVTEIVNTDGEWKPGRRLNGDETSRGTAVRLPHDEVGVQRVTVYRYR